MKAISSLGVRSPWKAVFVETIFKVCVTNFSVDITQTKIGEQIQRQAGHNNKLFWGREVTWVMHITLLF